MPKLRLIHLPEQYAGVTEDDTNNTNTAAAEFHTTRIHKQSRFPIDDATRNASSNNKEPPAVLGGDRMALLQAAIDEVNGRTCSFGSHDAARHQQEVPAHHEEMVLSSDEESENDSSSLLEFLDTVQPFQDEMVSSDEEIENGSTSSVHLDAIQHKSGNKRKRRAPKQSFDDRFNDLMAFKAKYGHCIVSYNGEDVSLGKWCNTVRGSYKKIQNNQKQRTKLSDKQIQRLSDAGFKWSLRKVGSGFDKNFNDLMAFKAKHGHCKVSHHGEDASLGRWCTELRGSYKKMQNNQKPRTKLSDEQIQRLSDAGFKWCRQKRYLTSMKTFDERFNDLMAFKTKYGHCDVSDTGEDASLCRWCSVVRGSYKKIQNNQKPITKLSDEQIQRLSDAGFKWCGQKRDFTSMKTFDERYNDLMAFKTKYGHCDVSSTGEDASLCRWCIIVRGSYKKIQNNQKPITKISDEQIQRLSDAGFNWSLRKVGSGFDKNFNDLMSFKAKYGHCKVSQRGEDASLGQWCNIVRGSYKKMQNNQKPRTKLSDEQIQRLSDAGFKWCL
jgi:hypothetical protein